MAIKILKTFVLLVLLAFPALGQDSQGHLICKPAKGENGSLGIVDYERIHRAINETIRRELEELNLKFEGLQNKVTKFFVPPGQRCNETGGLAYDGKCYFAPYISHLSRINYDEAWWKCYQRRAVIAEIHSRNQQQALEDFFRSKMGFSWESITFYLGMTYIPSGRVLRYRSGREISIGEFDWIRDEPFGSRQRVGLEISKHGDATRDGFFNVDGRTPLVGVICNWNDTAIHMT